MKNYIGVTGIANISDDVTTARSFRENELGWTYDKPQSIIGFLVNSKTLHNIPAKGEKIPHQRYPPVSSLKKILEYSGRNVKNAIHFSAKSDYNLEEEIKQIFRDNIYQDNFCRTLQLNILWPEKRKLENILKDFPEMEIILQIPNKVLNGENDIEKIKDYSELIQGILIDPSGGRKKEMDIDLSAKIYMQVKKLSPKLVIGIAGGLTPWNVREKIELFSKKIRSKDFSIDAEGGLRVYKKDENGKVVIDMLDPDLVGRYITQASQCFELIKNQ